MNKKLTVLYITYIEFGVYTSGSFVRPQKIYDAFMKLGFNVKLLAGSTRTKDKKKRIQAINEIKNWLTTNTPDFCYIESPTSYINFKEDRELIKFIHDRGIKIGYFYRDALYKLGKDVVFNENKPNIFSKKYIKYYYYKFRSALDERFLGKYIDMVYFPSLEMAKYFKFKNMDVLPPAGDIVNYKKEKKKDYIIYVGGITKSYGIDLLLDTFAKINEEQKIKLLIVCRENEVQNIDNKYLRSDWLIIKHASGKDLKKLYEGALFAVLPKKNNLYNSFAVSVKVYEYMSYGLPIVASNTKAMAELFNQYDLGLLADFTVDDFAKKITTLYNNEKLLLQYKNTINNCLVNNNLWTHRILKIVKDLIGGNDGKI